MRMKDAAMVAMVLGRELRDAMDQEAPGIEASIGAIRGHMQHAHPGQFDAAAYDEAVERGRRGELGW